MPDLKPLTDVDLFAAVGHWHPLFLHLPIGLLVALALVELRAVLAKRPASMRDDAKRDDGLVRSTLVVLLAITGPLAAATGWSLHETGEYAGIDWHEYTGIATGFLCLGIAWSYAKRPKLYRPLVFVAAALISVTGHLGANITHGTNYVLQPWLAESGSSARGRALADDAGGPVRQNLDASPESSDRGLDSVTSSADSGTNKAATLSSGVGGADTSADGSMKGQVADLGGPSDDGALTQGLTPEQSFAAIVKPIFDSACIKCHGERRQKEGLRLDTYAGLIAGSKWGSVLTPGNADASRLIEVLRLPEEDEAHMPPEDKPQLMAEEISALAAWVDSL